MPRKSNAADAESAVSRIAIQLAAAVKSFPLLESDECSIPLSELTDLVTVRTNKWSSRVQRSLDKLDSRAAQLPDSKRSTTVLAASAKIGELFGPVRQQIAETIAGYKSGYLAPHERRDALLWSWRAIKEKAKLVIVSAEAIRTLARREVPPPTVMKIVLTHPSQPGRGKRGADVDCGDGRIYVPPSVAKLIKDVFTNGAGWHPLAAIIGRDRGEVVDNAKYPGRDRNQEGLKKLIPRLGDLVNEDRSIKRPKKLPRTYRRYVLKGGVQIEVLDCRWPKAPPGTPDPK